ncbi:MAG: hypothetical protein R3F05_12125 [Planctomycetota bacterium]|nr:hypothetical protein [Planctomycetota bacterium]MCB9825530.1 hypothetical protein [Planctomycetota bacterium]MCB9900624.1 hypothetical protein [Planctomycetota bacterium]
MVVPGLSTPILPRRVRPASPAWPRLLGGLLLALLAAHGRVDAADDFNPPLLEVESGPWAKASVVAVVAIRDIRQNRQVALGPMLVRAQVERVLKRPEPPPGQTGIKAGDPVIAWVPGPKPTLDPRAPSAPMLAAEDRGRYVLFLSDSSSGSAYEVQALFTADGLEGEQKVEALSRLQVQLSMKGPEERVHATLAQLFRAFDDERHWTRENAAREMAWIARHHPSLLDADARLRLRRVAAGPTSRPQAMYLAMALADLGASPPPPARRGPASASARWRSAFERAEDAKGQARLLATRHTEARGEARAAVWEDLRWGWWHAPAEARVAWLHALPLRAPPADAMEWRGLYAHEESLPVLEGLVRAVGLSRRAEDVPWLAARLERADLWHAATLALARVRTADALEWLRRERLACEAEGADAERMGWLDHLLSDLFVQGEAAVR